MDENDKRRKIGKLILPIFQEMPTKEVDQVVFPPVVVQNFIINCYNDYITILNLDVMDMEKYIIKLPKSIIPIDYLFKQTNSEKRSFFRPSIQNVRLIHHQTKNNYMVQKQLLLVDKDDETYITMKNIDYEDGDTDDNEDDKVYYFQTLVLERLNKYKILL